MYFFLLSYPVLGAGLKYIDDAFDEKIFSKKYALILAPLLAILWAYTMYIDSFSATILLAILVYSGVIIGHIMAGWLRKETEKYKKIFFIFSKILISLVVMFLVPLFVKGNLGIILSVIVFILALLVQYKFTLRSVYACPLGGFVFFISSFSENIIILQTLVMFAYGITTSAYSLGKGKKGIKKNIKELSKNW